MKISVVTATMNSEATLRDTLASVLGQTYGEVEHIIVDGKSTDGTLALVKEFEPLYRQNGKELLWRSERDKGLYDAMNKGIGMATGDIIGILNSDDFYTTNDVLSRIANEIADADAVYADIHFVKPDDLTRCVRYYSSKHFAPRKMRRGFMPAHPSFYCRRQLYQTVGAFDTDFKVAADFEQLFRLIYLNRISLRYIDADFVTMRLGGASTAGIAAHRQILLDHLRAYKKNIPDRPFSAPILRPLNTPLNFILDASRYISKVFELMSSSSRANPR